MQYSNIIIISSHDRDTKQDVNNYTHMEVIKKRDSTLPCKLILS